MQIHNTCDDLMEDLDMDSSQEHMNEFRKQLNKGQIQKAYQELMQYIMKLRILFIKKYSGFAPGNIYHGYMDMTYFPLFPKSLKDRKLKIAIVFIYDSFRFEVWLAANNKKIQAKYWRMFKESGWNKYHIPSTIKGADSIVEYSLVDNPDFSDLITLTKQIEKGVGDFISDIEKVLSKH